MNYELGRSLTLQGDSEEALSELKTVEEMALRATTEIRHVLFKLRPLALETQGLTGALEQLADKMSQTYKQPCEMNIHPDVAQYLARHGIKADWQRVKNQDADTGTALIAFAEQVGADLIVAGAYGHSRLREMVLGGVTECLLRRAPVPVLMSH